MKRPSFVWLLLLVVLALVLAGCASSGNAAPQPSTGSGDQSSGGSAGAAGGAADANTVVITKDSKDKTVEMKVGQKLLVNLGEDYNWSVDVTPTFLLSQVTDAQLAKGQQGMYEAKMNGLATVQATGSPVCAKADPPCKDPNVQFNVNIKISAAE